MMKNGNDTKLFAMLSNNLEAFTREGQNKQSGLMATDIWTVKDGHVYAISEFLDLIARHIATHSKHVRRAK